MNQLLRTMTLSQRMPERLRNRLGMQAFMDIVTDNLSRVGIGHQAQIHRTAACRQISYIGYPDLLRSCCNDLLRARLEQIGVAVKAMKAVCCLVIRPLGLYQKTTLSEDLKQSISPYLQLPVRLAMQKEVKLAGTQTRLAHPDLADVLFQPVCFPLLAIRSTIALVVSLPTDAQKMTSPGSAQSRDLTLREDLPDRFFTTDTP